MEITSFGRRMSIGIYKTKDVSMLNVFEGRSLSWISQVDLKGNHMCAYKLNTEA